jgi:hypothetical protein
MLVQAEYVARAGGPVRDSALLVRTARTATDGRGRGGPKVPAVLHDGRGDWRFEMPERGVPRDAVDRSGPPYGLCRA